CLDTLRSARVRHEAYGEPPADAVATVDPADRVTLDDSVRLALVVVLERLSPAERAAFVLHDVFGFSFEDIGPIVGRSAAARRQLASRARRRIEEETGPARFELESEDDRRVTERFIAACAGGDLEGLMKVLDPDVVGQADTVIGVRPPVVGKRNVARNALSFFGP